MVNEITYRDCIKQGFLVSLVAVLVLLVLIISQGMYLVTSGGPVMFVIVLSVVVFLVVSLAYVVFSPIIYLIRKYIVKNH